MFPSVDTLHLLRTYKAIPSPDELLAMGWTARTAGKLKKEKWFNNGMKDISEPRLTIYQTYDGLFRLRANMEIPKLLYGDNIELPNQSDIDQALEIATTNISRRSMLPFDAHSANVCRIDYALNLKLEADQIKRFISRYQQFEIPRLLRTTIGNTTVYFENNSRRVRIYDKFQETVAKNRSRPDLHEKAKSIIRPEYVLPNETSVKRFAKRLGFKDYAASTMVSPENLNTAINELKDLIMYDSLDLSDEKPSHRIFRKAKDIKQAIRLAGFCEAVDYYGQDFYEIEELNYSKSTYQRNKRECQKLGL